jgi:hypothetical protein
VDRRCHAACRQPVGRIAAVTVVCTCGSQGTASPTGGAIRCLHLRLAEDCEPYRRGDSPSALAARKGLRALPAGRFAVCTCGSQRTASPTEGEIRRLHLRLAEDCEPYRRGDSLSALAARRGLRALPKGRFAVCTCGSQRTASPTEGAIRCLHLRLAEDCEPYRRGDLQLARRVTPGQPARESASAWPSNP